MREANAYSVAGNSRAILARRLSVFRRLRGWFPFRGLTFQPVGEIAVPLVLGFPRRTSP
jgi:hypothetical protein